MGYSNIFLQIPILSTNSNLDNTVLIESDSEGFFNFDKHNMDISKHILLIAEKDSPKKRKISNNNWILTETIFFSGSCMNISHDDKALFNNFLEEMVNIKVLKTTGRHNAGVTSESLKKKYQKMVIIKNLFY